MKVIFLDIDGVLNFHRVPPKDKIKHGIGQMSAIAVDLLNQYTTQNDVSIDPAKQVKLVISSTWRNATRQGTIQEYMSLFGITGDVIGVTPTNHTALRGNEIRDWIKSQSAVDEHSNDYVILDDDSDMLLWQKDNFILVDRWVGITPSTLYKMDKILGLNTTIDCGRFANRFNLGEVE